MNEKPMTSIPGFYAVYYTALAKTARSLGYALAVHGSMQNDLDLIAVPWTEDCASVDSLLSEFKERHGLTPIIAHEPVKPHGRRCFSFALAGDWTIDISVTPRGTP
jgi:hypothetical protein